MHYPTDFPDVARTRVEAEEIRASFEFDEASETAQWKSDKEKYLKHYILRVFLAFVNEACSRRLMTVDKTRDFCEEFLRRFTIQAYYSKGYPRGLQEMTSHLDGSILTRARTEFEKAPEWRAFQKALLQLADDQVVKSEAAKEASVPLVAAPESRTEAEISPRLRRGYRTEVRAWMDKAGLKTSDQAARRLGVSESTLKSIMSDKGKPRFGKDTLQRVLSKIGHTEEQ